MGTLIKEIDHYTVYSGTVSEHDVLNREYVRIECYYQGAKAGQILLGNSVTPGSYTSASNGEIDLHFPLSQFANIHAVLEGHRLEGWPCIKRWT